MKLAVLSDIHGNLPALRAVLDDIEKWQPDQVVVNGDVVNRGPFSRACLQLLLDRRWQIIEGNHEAYVLETAASTEIQDELSFEINRHCYWTCDDLGDHIDDLAELPALVTLAAPDGGEIRVTHASMQSNRSGIYPFSTDEQIKALMGQPPALFLVGHTHRPLMRRLNGSLVVNSGAVGLPFDSDWRAAYAQLEWRHDQWEARIVRLPYDRAAAEKGFEDSGYLADGGQIVRLILRELQLSQTVIFAWERQCRQMVVAGEMSLEESVDFILRHFS